MTQIIENEKALRSLPGMGGLQGGDVEQGERGPDIGGGAVHGKLDPIRGVDGTRD